MHRSQKLVMRVCGSNMWEELQLSTWKCWWKWSMPKRTAQIKDKREMSHFEKFVTAGNEKADELAKASAVLDEEFMAETRAKTVQQERE